MSTFDTFWCATLQLSIGKLYPKLPPPFNCCCEAVIFLDFKRLSLCIQDFLKRLPCNENTGFLRDTLYLSLLELHKYYIKEKTRLDIQQINNDTEKIWKDVELDKYDARWKECHDAGTFRTAVEENIQDNGLSGNKYVYFFNITCLV